MPPLHALFLSDGRPGHTNLTEGILAALARLRSSIISRVEVRRPAWMPGRVLSTLVNAGASPQHILQRIYGIDPRMLPAANVVVSAGGDTLAANIAAARLLNAPNIFYGSLRRYRPQDFSLVLTSYARNASLSNHLMTLKPGKLDADDYPPPHPIRRPGTANPPHAAGVLIGGDDGYGFRYDSTHWLRLLNFLTDMHRLHGTRWVVANSRRTPAAVSDDILRIAASMGGPIAGFVDVRTSGPGTLGALFAVSEAIIATADSSSMVSEGIWLRRPVVAVAPASAQFTPDEACYRDWLNDREWAATLMLEDLTPPAFLAALDSIKPMMANPLDQLAQALNHRLPQLSASITATRSPA